MANYTFTNEQGRSRTIYSTEEAKSIIIATATIRELNQDELFIDQDIKKVADAFNIDLSVINVKKSEIPGDFIYRYSFN